DPVSTLSVQRNNSSNDSPKVAAKAPKGPADLKGGAVTIDKAKESRLVHALGTIQNDSDYQRFGVKVELDLFDTTGAKVGTATDYTSVIEPRQSWHFRALVVEPSVSSAKIRAIKEQ